MKKNNLIDFLIVLLVYIAFSCLPFGLLKIPSWLISVFQIVAQVLVLFFMIYFVRRKTKLEHKLEKINLKNSLLLIPTLLVCFSNLVYLVVSKGNVSFIFSLENILLILLNVFVVLNEEIIFRLLLISNLENKKNWWMVLISGVVFGLCHITRFLSSFNPVDLVVVAYTIPLGLLLAISYLMSKSLIAPITIHLLFNIFNNLVFMGNYNDPMFYIVSIIVGIVVALYVTLIIVIKNRNNKKQYIN